MACKSGPNIGKASLIFSMDGATPRGFSSVDNEIEDRGRGRNRRKRRKCGISGGSGRDKSKGRGSFSMDGTNDFISVPIDSDDDMSAFSNFTFLAWIYPTTSANFWILSKGIEGDDDDSEFGLYLNSDGKAEVIIYDQSEEKFTKSITANALAANKWHFIAATYNGSNLQVSANLVDKGANQASTVAIENTDTQIYIGRSHGSNFANGFISSIYMYDEALSDREISDFYIATRSKFGDVAAQVAGTGTGDEDTETSNLKLKVYTTSNPAGYQFFRPPSTAVAAGESYTINWGNGTTSTIDSNTGTSVIQPYDSSDANSEFTITVSELASLTNHPFLSNRINSSFSTWHYYEVLDWGDFPDRSDNSAASPFGLSVSYNRKVPSIPTFLNGLGLFKRGQSFNNAGSSDINNWDTSHFTLLYQAFWRCYVFNQPIGNWDVSNVTRMDQCFYSARDFNQDIGSWDTSSCTNFTSMFYGCSDFDQDLSSWDFRAIDSETRLSNFMYGCTLSTANYNALLVRLKNQADDMDFNGDDVVVSFGNSTHSGTGTSARSYLINEHDWTITDGGSA